MFEQKQFGKRIQTLRKSKKLSQKEFADEMNISLSHVGKMEAGIAAPSLDLCLMLGEYFSVSMDYLLTGTEAGPKTPKMRIREVIDVLTLLEQQLS